MVMIWWAYKDFIEKSLRFSFRTFLNQRTFSKASVVLILFTKNNKQSIINYRPASLLSKCGKIHKRLLYNEMFFFFIENGLICQNQLGFIPRRLWHKPSLVNYSWNYKSFDDDWEVRGVFLDISKAIDNVWHQGVLINLIKANRKQPSRGVLKKRHSENKQQIYRRKPMLNCDLTTRKHAKIM